MKGYILHPEALIDLDEIWEFIAQDNIDAADRVREEIYDAIQSLLPFPRQGYLRPKLTSRNVRFKNVRNFVIAYAPDQKPLLILTVIHGRRSPRVMAAILRGRE
jgi:plasmid stabilization system protein ParE